MASLIFSKDSSSVSPWLTHPGIEGHSTTHIPSSSRSSVTVHFITIPPHRNSNLKFDGIVNRYAQSCTNNVCGVSPPPTRSFCFGKRTQNHFRPCAALRVPPPPLRIRWLRNSLRSNSPRLKVDSGLRLRRTQGNIVPQRITFPIDFFVWLVEPIPWIFNHFCGSKGIILLQKFLGLVIDFPLRIEI